MAGPIAHSRTHLLLALSVGAIYSSCSQSIHHVMPQIKGRSPWLLLPSPHRLTCPAKRAAGPRCCWGQQRHLRERGQDIDKDDHAVTRKLPGLTPAGTASRPERAAPMVGSSRRLVTFTTTTSHAPGECIGRAMAGQDARQRGFRFSENGECPPFAPFATGPCRNWCGLPARSPFTFAAPKGYQVLRRARTAACSCGPLAWMMTGQYASRDAGRL